MSFFSLPSGIGVDISEHHIRLAQMGWFGRSLKLHEIVLLSGLVEDERVVDQASLSVLFLKEVGKSAFARCGKKTTLLIPESRVFSSNFSCSKEEHKTTEAVLSQGQKEIPLPFSDACVDVVYGKRAGENYPAVVYAAQKSVVDSFAQIFSSCFPVVAAEANTKALWRLLARFAPQVIPQNTKELMAVVDMGHSWTTISLYSAEGLVVYSRTLSHKQMETGAKTTVFSKKMAQQMIEMVKEAVLYFEKQDKSVSHIILAGVEAAHKTVKEMAKKEQESLPISLIGDLVTLPEVSPEQIHAYGAAMGAALRSLHPRRHHLSNHNFIS